MSYLHVCSIADSIAPGLEGLDRMSESRWGQYVAGPESRLQLPAFSARNGRSIALMRQIGASCRRNTPSATVVISYTTNYSFSLKFNRVWISVLDRILGHYVTPDD